MRHGKGFFQDASENVLWISIKRTDVFVHSLCRINVVHTKRRGRAKNLGMSRTAFPNSLVNLQHP